MLTLDDIFYGLLLPLVVAAVLTLLSGRWLGGAVGLAAAYATGQALVDRWPRFPPPTTEQWLIPLVLLAFVAEVMQRVWGRVWLRWSVRVVLAALLVGLTLRPRMQYAWGLAESIAWGAGIGIAVLAFWSVTSAWIARQGGLTTIVCWTMVAVATAVVCTLGGSQKIGQFGGALAAAIGGCGVAALGDRRLSLSAGGGHVLFVAWSGVVLNAYFYALVPWWAAGLLAVAPVGTWIIRLRPLSRLKGWRSSAAMMTAVAVPLVGAVVPMIVQFLRSMQQAGESPYTY